VSAAAGAVLEKATGAAVKATGAAVKAPRRKVTAHEAEAEAVAAIVQGVGRGGEALEAWPEMVAVAVAARVGAAAAGVRASTAFQRG
jgi:hypothetical protein